mgnify:CR=1 FL=1
MKKDGLRHYLLVFDHRAGKLRDEPREFTDPSEATAAYAEVEQEYGKDDLVEVVLIGSDSMETVRATHANYFDGTVALIRLLERLVTANK